MRSEDGQKNVALRLLGRVKTNISLRDAVKLRSMQRHRQCRQPDSGHGTLKTHRWKYTVYCVVTIRGRMSGQRVVVFHQRFPKNILAAKPVLNARPLPYSEIRAEWGQLFPTVALNRRRSRASTRAS